MSDNRKVASKMDNIKAITIKKYTSAQKISYSWLKLVNIIIVIANSFFPLKITFSRGSLSALGSDCVLDCLWGPGAEPHDYIIMSKRILLYITVHGE